MTDTQADLTERARMTTREFIRECLCRLPTPLINADLETYGNEIADAIDRREAAALQSEREATARELQCLRDEKECWRQGYYLAVDFIQKQTKQHEAEARRAALAVVFAVRDKPGRSLEWCNACNEIQEGIRSLASPAPQEKTR